MNTQARRGVFFSFQRVKKELFFVKYSSTLTLVIKMNVYLRFSKWTCKNKEYIPNLCFHVYVFTITILTILSL